MILIYGASKIEIIIELLSISFSPLHQSQIQFEASINYLFLQQMIE